MISSARIKEEALRLGFYCCGLAKAERVSLEAEREYMAWLRNGGHASMDYLERNVEKRLDPRLLVDGVRTIVSVALSYAPSENFADDELKLASYALGQDYHDVVKKRLAKLAQALGIEEYRVFCDSAPVLERYWAERSGIGWIGKNRQLIIPHAGNMFFLGELFIMDEADEYDSPCENRCGSCRKCIEACPMSCLGMEHFDAFKCLSYQTIENRGEISAEARAKLGDMFYGCDRCTKVCPWNSFSVPAAVEEFLPKAELMAMKREDWRNLSVEDYRRLFKGSAVKRAKYEGLRRNIDAVLEERGE